MIREISASETWRLRQQAMWPDKELSHVILPDDDNGQHFGLYANEELVSVISLFVKNREIQFRKFATAPDHQGKGHGTILLKHVLNNLCSKENKYVWCNARKNKISFYEKFGLQKTNEMFEKDGEHYIIMKKFIT